MDRQTDIKGSCMLKFSFCLFSLLYLRTRLPNITFAILKWLGKSKVSTLN